MFYNTFSCSFHFCLIVDIDMSELDAIKISINGPVTEDSLVDDLERIGVVSGMTLIVHSSLSSMGWVCGREVAVINALEKVLGEQGTLIMPTQSADLSDPAKWENPPVDKSWWQAIRDTMPAYDLALTPTREMGAIPECFRKQAGVIRSSHPQFSFAVWGKNAEFVINDHSLGFGLGNGSPLARIYELQGCILLIGVGHDANTSLHLAEYRAEFPSKTIRQCKSPIIINGQRQWQAFEDIDLDSDDFPEIGEAYENEGGSLQNGKVGYAQSILIPQKTIVDFAVGWIQKNRA